MIRKSIFKKRHLKQLLSMVLATVVTVTSVPITTNAANELPAVGLEMYDYSRIDSIMQDGKVIVNINNTTGEMQQGTMPMSFGEMVYLQFALPYNTNYTMKVLDASGNDLGYMYAKFYTEHVDGSVESGYTPRGKTLDAIKLELKNFVYEMPYSPAAPATAYYGIGLTGEVLPYGTLAEYYDFYGMEAPAALSLEAPTEEEVPAAEEEPPAAEEPPAEEEPPAVEQWH